MFYHSFPRPKRGQDSIKKGLKILESFLKSGILFTPEIITYKHEKAEYYVAQSRFCLTQIDISELKAHEKYFGGFHFEFTNHQAYSLGAMPVFYLPSAEPDRTEWPLKKLAAVYLRHLFELKNICQYIEMPDAEKGNFLGALQGIGSMFYPADRDGEGEHEDLYYFRQREWRIIAGISMDGKQLDRKPDRKEKEFIKSIDPGFFEKEIVYADRVKRSRIDGCTVMPATIYKTKPEPGEEGTEPKTETKPVQELVERIIVPKMALEEAIAIAKQNHFDPARIVDVVTAMDIAAIELECEAEKTRHRIRLIRAAYFPKW